MRPLLVVLFAVSGLSCISGNTPVRVTAVFPVDSACVVLDGLTQGGGTLDASGAGTYIINMRITSELQAYETLDQMGRALNTPLANTFTIDEVALTYTSRNPSVSFEGERLPVYATILPDTQDNDFRVHILGPKAAQKLRDNVTDPLADPPMTLFVNVALRGHLESGGPMQTNTITFPITVRTSNTACTNLTFAPTGPCGTGGGQDGTAVVCCTGPGTPVGCP